MGAQPKTDPLAEAVAPEANGSATEDIQVKGYCARWRKQMLALLYKTGEHLEPSASVLDDQYLFTVLLAVRNWPTFVMRLIVPALFVFLIWLINILVVAGLNIFNQARCMHTTNTSVHTNLFYYSLTR